MRYVSLIFLVLLFIACNTNEPKKEEFVAYATSNNALVHYRQGWVRIMDEGRYGAAEDSYRDALEIDPDFLVGKSVLARLTLDLQERLKLQEELEKEKVKINGDERLVLDVYLALVRYTNLRDLQSAKSRNALTQALELGEKNLRILVHKYPMEVYLKAEYLEFLHSAYGPQRTLDSLSVLTSDTQKNNPFLLGFSAGMYAELGAFELALQQANHLTGIVNDTTSPKPFVVLADVYLKMDSLKLAQRNVAKAVTLDPRNLDASRLKTKIEAALDGK